MIARVRGVIAARSGVQIDVAGVGLDVDEHRRRAEQHDHLGGGGEGERRRDDLVARLDAQRHQRDQQRLGAAGAR